MNGATSDLHCLPEHLMREAGETGECKIKGVAPPSG